jgi:hypothetical protein
MTKYRRDHCSQLVIPPFVKLGNPVRYTDEDVDLLLARQLELSRG